MFRDDDAEQASRALLADDAARQPSCTKFGAHLIEFPPIESARPLADSAPGLMILSTTPGCGAARAGLRYGDLIVSANGQPIRSAQSFVADVNAATGPSMTISVIADNGQTRSASILFARGAAVGSDVSNRLSAADTLDRCRRLFRFLVEDGRYQSDWSTLYPSCANVPEPAYWDYKSELANRAVRKHLEARRYDAALSSLSDARRFSEQSGRLGNVAALALVREFERQSGIVAQLKANAADIAEIDREIAQKERKIKSINLGISALTGQGSASATAVQPAPSPVAPPPPPIRQSNTTARAPIPIAPPPPPPPPPVLRPVPPPRIASPSGPQFERKTMLCNRGGTALYAALFREYRGKSGAIMAEFSGWQMLQPNACSTSFSVSLRTHVAFTFRLPDGRVSNPIIDGGTSGADTALIDFLCAPPAANWTTSGTAQKLRKDFGTAACPDGRRAMSTSFVIHPRPNASDSTTRISIADYAPSESDTIVGRWR